MTVDILQQKKEEVASVYLKDLKQELWFLKWSIVWLFWWTLKDMMVSKDALGEKLDTTKLNFWEKLLVTVSPSTAEKVFSFVKEKQEKIQTAKTEAELDSLKGGIVPAVTAATTTTTAETPATTPTQPTTTTETNPASTATTQETSDEKEKKAREDAEKLNEKEQTSNNKKENIATWVAVWWWLWLSVLATERIYKLQESKKIAKNIDLKTPEQFANKMKEQFASLSKQLEKEAALNPKLTKFQSKALSKSAKEFESVAKGMDKETLNAVNMLWELDAKLPASMLKSIDPAEAKKLLWLTLTEDVLAEIKLGKTPTAVEWLSKEVITVLKNADNLEEAKSMVYVLTKSKWVTGFLKWIKWIAFLDLISTGFDVRVLCEGLDEAEAYRKLNAVRADTKREHQWVQFGASVAITAIGIIATCAAAGSVVPWLWTAVGAAVGALGYAASVAIDIYYDKVEFYLQNEEDFKKQYRTEIKQAIIQSAAAEEWNMNFSERLDASATKAWSNRAERNMIPFGTLLSEKEKLTTTEDAWKALLRQEEYKKVEYNMIKWWYDSGKTEEEYKKTLSADEVKEYEAQKAAINKVITKRLEYVKLFMYENKTTKEYKEFVSAMKSGMGMKKIEKILADSKTYYDMQQTGTDQYITGCTTIDEYTTKYMTKLKTEDAAEFAKLEAMWKSDPLKFWELYRWVENFEEAFANAKKSDEYTYKDNIDVMQKRLDFIKRYYSYKMLGVPIEEQTKFEMNQRDVDNNKIEQYLAFDDETKLLQSWTSDQTKYYFTNTWLLDRAKTNIEVSDNVGQNIIYRIAAEIHGYTWTNDMKELIAFFSMGKENATGLYFDDKWIVNNDRAIDKWIDIDQFEKMTSEDILKERTRSNNWNRVLEYIIPNPLWSLGADLGGWSIYSVYGFTDNASMIDTPTEGMDDKLNEEYRKRVSAIICQEKAYSQPSSKKLVEQKIVEYITTNAKDNGYVELPYYLVVAAKKANIGDLQKYLFAYKDKKITACTTKLYLDNKLDFSQTKTAITKEYISWTVESLWENTQKYIDYVDTAKKQFEKLITHDVDDLDIPKEYLEIYQAKITEWETIKQSMYTLDPETAKAELETKYEEYHDYFENAYIGMLAVISKFGANAFSDNDLDSATYHQQVEYMVSQLSSIAIGKDWTITGPMDQLTDMQKKAFTKILASQKIEGKTIPQLAKSKDDIDKKKAIRGVKQIIKSILETEMLDIDEKGNITWINHGEQSEYVMRLMYWWLENRLKINVSDSIYFDVSKYTIEATAVDMEKLQIKTLTWEQEKVTTQSDAIEKIIKETEPDLVYPGRWLVSFDPEKNVLSSRGKTIKIDPEKLSIVGLSTTFATLQELVMAANLMNWFKYKFPWVKDFYFGSWTMVWGYYGIYQPVEWWMDTRILELDTIKEKFPSMLTADNDVKENIITYINSIT